jgi:phosphate transport system substrate-binding protein
MGKTRREMMKRVLQTLVAASLVLFFSGCGRGRALSVVGSTSVQPFAEVLAQNYHKKFPDRDVVDVQGGGSTAGLVAVSSGLADIGTCSRSLSPEEAKQFTAIVIARDGLAVVVHPTNPVRGLTTPQIQRLFSGRIQNWKEVGGPDEPVRLITREEGSGTRESFVNLVMKDEKISEKALVEESNGSVKEYVKGDEGAVGYMSLGQVGQEVKALEIDGVVPSAANALSGIYTLARPFLFVTKGTPSPRAQQFIDYVLSDEGQKTLESEGLIRPQ